MPLPENRECDVLIVGAGPTGLVLAYELARRGVHFRLIDKNEGPAEQSRALLIQVRSLETFAFMGLIDEFLQKGLHVDQLRLVVNQKPVFQNRFQALDSPYPFPLVLPQNDTEAILLSALAQKGIHVERRTELKSFESKNDFVKVLLQKDDGEEESFDCSYLVGCDGAHSAVRHGLDLPFKGAPYPEGFILADVDLESSLNPKDIYLFWHDQGFLAVLPMRDKWVRLISMRAPGTDAFKKVSIEEFQSNIDRAIPGSGKILKAYWLENFHLHHRGVPRYQVDHVFLAGDAAHIHSPAGGQGMNTGIQDAFNLAWKLSLKIQNPGFENVLESYSPERHPVGERVLKTTDRFFRMVVTAGFSGKLVRNYLLPFAAKFIFPHLTGTLTRFVSQLQVNYRGSACVSEGPAQHWPASSPKPGERAPDGPLKDCNNGKALTLYEIFREMNFLLLVFGNAQSIQTAKLRLSENLNLSSQTLWKTVFICRDYSELGNTEAYTFQDMNGILAKKYGIQDGIYLIRPDRYIAYRQQGFNFKDFQRYLLRISSDESFTKTKIPNPLN